MHGARRGAGRLKRDTKGVRDVTPEPNKIGASTPYDFEAKNLTAYGGLLPVASMLEKLSFRQLVEETLTVKRKTKAMTMYQFVLAMVLACYVGFSRLYHLRFLERERVWAAASVQLTEATLDTDTTVHTLFVNQMGARKGYNPKNKGKKSYQPILTFLAETKEYVAGALRTGDRPSGKEIAAHLDSAYAALPATVKTVYGRAGPGGRPGFYCWEASRLMRRGTGASKEETPGRSAAKLPPGTRTNLAPQPLPTVSLRA
jgi:hypothetical protein